VAAHFRPRPPPTDRANSRPAGTSCPTPAPEGVSDRHRTPSGRPQRGPSGSVTRR
jgi:hypothetical protein